MLRDTCKDVGEPGLRIDIVELGGSDQRVHDGGALTAAIRAAEQPRLAPESDAAQSPFGGIVRNADPAVIEEAGERGPATEHVVDRLGEIVVAREPGELPGQPGVEIFDQRGAALLPGSETSLAR